MKKQILLLLFVLSYTFGNSQSTDWKQINTAHKNSIEVIYQATDGTLFGQFILSNKLVISSNNGENWTPIIFDGNSYLYGYYYNNPFKESNNGVIYLSNDYTIYTLDIVNLKFDTLFTIDGFSQIFDYDVLYNGDIVVGTSSNLFLYSETGTFKNLTDWSNTAIKFLASPDANGKNYITTTFGSAEYLWEFTSDLELVGDKKYIGSQFLLRHGDRLITEKKYSDDGGITWNFIQGFVNESIRVIYVAHDDKIYFSSWDGIYISNDGGKSVEFNNFGIDNIIFASSNSSVFVLGADNVDCIPDIYFSTDNGSNLQKVKTDIGEYYSESIYPGVDEILFNKSCGTLFQRNEDTQGWQLIENINQSGNIELANDVLHLSNTEILASFDFSSLSKSNDNGKSWNKVNKLFHFNPDIIKIIEKNGILYNVSSDSLAISRDFGDNWITKVFRPDLFFTNYTKFEINQNEEIFYYDNSTFNNVVKYNTDNQIITPIEFTQVNRPIVDFVTSFDGTQLYILTQDWNTNGLKIYLSYDSGQTFQEYFVGIGYEYQGYRLKTDHLRNIYVYSESMILMSSDQGASWINITPDFPELVSINDLQISYDNYIYLATHGKGILKFNAQLSEPKILTVSLYDDLNKNCLKDANEGSINHGKIVVNNNYVKAVDANGEATFYVHKDQNKVSVQFNDKIYEYCQVSYDVDMSSGTNAIAIPLKTKKYCADLVTSISTPFLRRCFDNTYYGLVCNEGNIDAEDTEVKIILDDYFDLIQASLPQISHVGNELTLDAGTIKSGECKNITFTINLSCDATLGQEHCVIIDSESRSQNCNSIETRTEYTECQENIGSFDPNDKAIFVNGVRNQEYLEPGDKLEYMIRFQNTGTDTAFTVKIQDPISTKFDVASIRPVAASHEYTWSVDNGTLNVVFKQIMLVDSFKNEPASHGFIKFEITLDNETMVNQEVSNIAGIYFDFNEPIITNEVVTPVGKPVSTHDWAVSPLYIYPNPTSDHISIKLNDKALESGIVNIFDEKGRKFLTTNFNVGLNNKIPVGHLPSGFYIVQFINNKAVFKAKFVKL